MVNNPSDEAVAVLRVAHKHVVAHWMVALSTDVGGPMFETELMGSLRELAAGRDGSTEKRVDSGS